MVVVGVAQRVTRVSARTASPGTCAKPTGTNVGPILASMVDCARTASGPTNAPAFRDMPVRSAVLLFAFPLS